MLSVAIQLLSQLLSKNSIDSSHGIVHAIAVLNHSREALKHEELSKDEIQAIKLAALLHDADDSKFFPNNTNNENTRHILKELDLDNEQ